MGNLVLLKYWLGAKIRNNKILKRFVNEDKGSAALQSILMLIGAALIIGVIVAFFTTGNKMQDIWEQCIKFATGNSTSGSGGGSGSN